MKGKAKPWGRTLSLAAAIALVATVLSARQAEAFECPKHIAEAKIAVDGLEKLMETMKGKMPSRELRFIHSVLDDAKMFLGGARHSHEEALGYNDHVRAIIRTHETIGHVVAATLLHDAFMKKLN